MDKATKYIILSSGKSVAALFLAEISVFFPPSLFNASRPTYKQTISSYAAVRTTNILMQPMGSAVHTSTRKGTPVEESGAITFELELGAAGAPMENTVAM